MDAAGHGGQAGSHQNVAGGRDAYAAARDLIIYQAVRSGSAPNQVVVGNVPQAPQAFQPREELLGQLREAGPGVRVVRAVTGMRGVGKTQLAAAYARECIDAGWRLVAWVNAETMAEVLGGLAEVAAALGIEAGNASVEKAGQRVRACLEADGERRLVVFDNVTDANALRPYVPAAGKAQVLITSTSEGTAGLGQATAVDVFSEDEAIAFLAERAGRDDPAGARELSHELGYLPLALAQAAAVIAAQRLSPAVYLNRLRSLSVAQYLAPGDGDPYPHGLAEAISLSISAVTATDSTGLCGPLLDVIALLSPSGTSRDLLYSAGQAGALLRPAQPSAIDEALGRLAGASLLAFSDDCSAVTAHRMVSRVARERGLQDGTLAADGKRICELLDTVSGSLREPWRSPLLARHFVQHVLAVNEHVKPAAGDDALVKDLLELRGKALSCLVKLGDSATQAIGLGESLLPDCERVLGEHHADTLASRGNLAIAYETAGRLDAAIALHERTVAFRERTSGESHPDTLRSRNNLAVAYHQAGRVSAAILLFERILADRERTSGESHPETLTVRANLAHAYREAGRCSEAIALYEQALAGRVSALGEEHPDTMTARDNLAQTFAEAGCPEKAIPLHERALAGFTRLLGDSHPATLTSRNNLAEAYAAGGRAEDAIPLHERTLADRVRVLGDDHPETTKSRSNLAATYHRAGRAGEAVPLLERALADYVRVLGELHPDTLTSRNNLACVHLAAGRARAAVPLFEATVAGLEQVLGAGHPHTQEASFSLAMARLRARKQDEPPPGP